MLRSLHRWLGLALSLLVIVISITGILLVWSPEYVKLTVPEARSPIVDDLESLGQAVDNILTTHPAKTVRLIEFNPRDLGVHKVVLQDAHYAWHDQSGGLIQAWASNERLEDWLLDLHHRFLLGNTVGLNMAGFSGILLLPLVVVGFFLWWPTRKAADFKLWPSHWRFGQILRSHRNMGVVALLPIMIVAVTGVILVYPTESAQLLLGDPARQSQRQTTLTGYSPQLSTQQKLQATLTIFPDAKVRWVRPPNGGYEKFIVGVQRGDSWNRLGKSYVVFSDHVPEESLNAMAQTADKRLFDFMFPMHTGMLPLWYRLLLTVFGLLLLIVSAFGVWSWAVKPRKHHG